MKRLILAMAVIAFSTATVKAQDDMAPKKVGISVAANIGLPTTTGYSFAVGGDLQADFAATEGLKITVSGGYENYSFKKSLGGGSFGFIPLLAGAKFNLGSDKLYGHAQLGYGFASEGGGGAFSYAPSIGYYLSPNFDASLKYLAFSKNGFTLGSINLRLAYNF
jgi:hypothetical protein